MRTKLQKQVKTDMLRKVYTYTYGENYLIHIYEFLQKHLFQVSSFLQQILYHLKYFQNNGMDNKVMISMSRKHGNRNKNQTFE